MYWPINKGFIDASTSYSRHIYTEQSELNQFHRHITMTKHSTLYVEGRTTKIVLAFMDEDNNSIFLTIMSNV